jgi:transposase-like protein
MSYQNFQPPMRPELVVCPKCPEEARGKIGIHAVKERRYKCYECGKTFAETSGTPLHRLKYPSWVVIVVLTLLAYGCPIQTIVMAFGLDERTVTSWHLKAGQHGQAVQQAVICQGQIEVGQVQVDELYIKTQYGAVWLATAMSVFSRLFLWGAVGVERNTWLVAQVVVQVRAAMPLHSPLLWVTDGFAGWAQAINQVFRDPLYTGQLGRPCLCLWPNLHLVQGLP